MKYKPGFLPFNMRLMSGNRDKLKNLTPVTSSQLHSNSSDQLHPEGLFSQEIFGRVGDSKRMKTLSYIDLHTKVIHPLVWKNIEKVSSWYTEIFMCRRYATWDDKLKQFQVSDATSGETGPAFFLKHLPEIEFIRNESIQRGLRVDVIEKYRNTAVYDYLLVLPAGHRDLEEGRGGNLKCDDINDSYRSLIGLSKTIDKSDLDGSFNHRTQAMTQQHVNSIFEQIFNFLKGKGGFTASKWTKRNVEHGTRTVFSIMRLNAKDLEGPQKVSINDVHVGLAQTMRGTLPLTLNKISTGIGGKVFNQDGTANVIDKKTLKSKIIDVDPRWKELYTTEEGMLSLIKEFKVDDYKFNDCEVSGHAIALIYRDDKGFQIGYDIDDFKDEFKPHVRPITKYEIYYYFLAFIDREVGCWCTRYPFATEDSMFPAMAYMKTTVTAEPLYEYDADGNITEKMYREFPILGGASLATACPHPNRLAKMGADHDGDTLSIEFVMTTEAVKELMDYLLDPLNMISNGKFSALFSTDVASWVIKAYTSTKPVTP